MNGRKAWRVTRGHELEVRMEVETKISKSAVRIVFAQGVRATNEIPLLVDAAKVRYISILWRFLHHA